MKFRPKKGRRGGVKIDISPSTSKKVQRLYPSISQGVGHITESVMLYYDALIDGVVSELNETEKAFILNFFRGKAVGVLNCPVLDALKRHIAESIPTPGIAMPFAAKLNRMTHMEGLVLEIWAISHWTTVRNRGKNPNQQIDVRKNAPKAQAIRGLPVEEWKKRKLKKGQNNAKDS